MDAKIINATKAALADTYLKLAEHGHAFPHTTDNAGETIKVFTLERYKLMTSYWESPADSDLINFAIRVYDMAIVDLKSIEPVSIISTIMPIRNNPPPIIIEQSKEKMDPFAIFTHFSENNRNASAPLPSRGWATR